MASKETLHRLVDELPDAEVQAAERFLEYLRALGDPVLRAFLTAPEDEEPLTPEEAAESDAAWRAYQAGQDQGEPLHRLRERAG